MNYFAKSLPLMVSLILFGHSAAALGPGDLAFTGYNGDGEDNLAFVALAPIPASTDILLSDNEWNGGVIGGSGAFNDTAESVIKWTAPAGGLAAGTIVLINDIELTGPALTTSTGSVAYVLTANLGVGASGDAFFAYLGNNQFPSNFLTVIVSGATTFAGNLNNTGLSFGANALSVTPGTPDVMAYTGPRAGLPSFASYLPYLHNPTNWITEDGTGNQEANGVPPEVPFDATPFTIAPVGPEAPTLTLTPAGVGQVTVSWAPNTPGFVLQETLSLSPTNWINSVSGATNPITLSATNDSRFYRLFKP